MKDSVRIFEVGPRDGLQNEARTVPLDVKTRFVQDLVRAGLKDLEVGAFVRADRVPQMADTEALLAALPLRSKKFEGVRTWSLVPNRKGLERAIQAGCRSVAVFTAASETFAKKNIGMGIAQSLSEFGKVIDLAHENGMEVRGYVSTAFHCPYEGKIAPRKALGVIEKLARLGVAEVSIGDTIGKASPHGVDSVVKPAIEMLGAGHIAVHFHDTYGTALANTLRSLEWGVRTVDASAGGLGGCPYAPGATGNLATEDLVWMIDGLGVSTGVSYERLCEASLRLAEAIRRPISSRALQAYLASRKKRP